MFISILHDSPYQFVMHFLRGVSVHFILTWVVTAIACAAATWIVPGMQVMGGYMGILIFALTVALVNASIRPIMQTVSLPITVITLMPIPVEKI